MKNGKEICLFADDAQVKSYLSVEFWVFYKSNRIIARFNLNFVAAIIRGDKYEK